VVQATIESNDISRKTQTMKILLIEDDESLADLVVENLTRQKQYIIEWSSNGSEGLELAESYEYDIILLDVALPELDGIRVCQNLREQGNRTPILLLTAHDNITKKVAGLDAGADDYLVKPFDVRELLARIRALSRRGNDNLLPVLQWGNLSLDPNNCQVTHQKNQLKLTAKEYSLLELFLRHPQRIFSQGSLIEKIWSWEESPSENAVRTQIKGLRSKLREVGIDPNMIETIYGLGYRLKEAPSSQQAIAEQLPSTESLVMATSSVSSKTTQVPLDRLSAIWQKYQSEYRDRIRILEEAVQAIKQENLSADLQQKAISTAHTLVGSLGSFGYTQSSQICSEIEVILQSYDRLDYEISSQLDRLLATLLIQFNSPPTLPPPAQIPDNMTLGNDEPNLPYSSLSAQYKLLIVDDDFPLTQALVSEAITWGIDATVAGNLSQAREAIADALPDAILLDLSFPDANNGGLELLQELTAQQLEIPVIALTARESFAARVEVARLGGKGFLTKPVSPTQAMETVASILEQTNLPDAKILVVDNRVENLNAIADLLAPWGFEVVLLQNAGQFWDILEQSSPDLIIAQLEMEGVSGIELCQVVRNDPRWCHLPVLIMSPHDDIETIQQICSVGVDDHISFPVVQEELLARIFNRLDKERYRRQLAETDSLTGIANRRASLQRLARLLRIAKRQNKSWCFVVIDLDDFKQINDDFGHDTGDRVLRRLGQLLKQEFRSEDVIARWGGEEFVLGLYDMSKEAAISRLREFLVTCRQQNFAFSEEETFQVTFSAGVAEYPTNGTTLEALYQYGDLALYQAKAEGKNQII
jgi:diguanylate cyclase (GGDEF)-like protein